MSKTPRNIFIEGPVPPQFIADDIARHSTKTSIGAHQIFLGQVRADQHENGVVTAIEYTAYEDMVQEEMNTIREELFSHYELTCLHVYHSLGIVKAGEISLFVFASSPHRKAAIDACAACVEAIKKRLPVWGKEIIEGDNYTWKKPA